MRNERGWIRCSWPSLAVILFCSAVLRADPVTLEKPLYSEVFIRSRTTSQNNEKVAGNLLKYDDDNLTIKTSKGERDLKWIELTGTSAYALKSRLIDKTKAHDWLELGRFAWSMNAREQAKTALATAQRLDASLKPEASAILASESGSALKTIDPSAAKNEANGAPATAPAPSAGGSPSDATGASPAAEGVPSLPPSQGGGRIGKEKLVKYQKSTPDQDAAAIATARKVKDQIGQRLKINFAELSTDHFIIFTDWDRREYGFLKDNLEGAYACVSQQFEIPVRENVFVGKLPVFMFAKQGDFKKFAGLSDGFSPGDGVAGYYATADRKDGIGHMAMWKPDPTKTGGDIHKAEIQWAYVLTHEFTHAFVARYRSNERVPRWLNEGVAEVLANQKFPRMGVRPFARMMASKGSDQIFMSLFDDEKMPGGEMYPVMMTMVETILMRDKRAFLAYFDDLKSGADPEEALKKYYKLDNAGLIGAWKQYVMSHQ